MLQNDEKKGRDRDEPKAEKAGECLVPNVPEPVPACTAPGDARDIDAPAQGLPGGEGVEPTPPPCSVYMGSSPADFGPKGASSPSAKKKSKGTPPAREAQPAAAEGRAAWLDGAAAAAALLGCVTFETARRPAAHAPKALHSLCRQHLAEGREYFETGTQLWVSPEGVRRLAALLNTPAEIVRGAMEARAVVELRVVKIHPNPQRLQARREKDGAIVAVRVRDAAEYRVGNPIYARAVSDSLYEEARGNRLLLRRLAGVS